MDLRVLTWLAWALEDKDRYTSFSITRRNGSDRRIDAPIKPLKDVQRALAAAFLQGYRPPAHVHGFASGRSPKSNAAVHVRKFHLFRVDIQDFFPSITYRRIKGLFRAWPFKYPDEVATLLARICCHNDSLPQGAPTSPILSNFICRRMDRELATLAAAEHCHFSRYADDLAFSTSQHLFPVALGLIEGGVPVAGQALRAIILKNGFTINASKTTLTGPTQRQRVTGVVVNKKINVPREYVRSLRSLLYIWRKYKQPAAEVAMAAHAPPSPNRPSGKPAATFQHIVRGRVQYVGSIKGFRNSTYAHLARRLSEVDDGFSPPARPIIQATLYTEGPSDWRHILAAQRYFHERGEYAEIHLGIGKEPSKEGHNQLRKFAEKLAQEEQTEFSVCLFDSDVKEAIDAVGPDGWKRYGPRVVAVGLAAPPAKDEKDPLFVESLYSESTLKTPLASGKRLYLRTEFDSKTGHHREEDCSIPGAGSKEFIQQKVHAFKTKKRVSASKVEFSKAVLEDSRHFGDDIFDGFRPTLERIERALSDSWDQIR